MDVKWLALGRPSDRLGAQAQINLLQNDVANFARPILLL